MAGPLTPDFYRYEWHPLSGVRLDGELVVAEWADGAGRSRNVSTVGLAARAVTILEAMNYQVLGPEAVRDKLHLTKH
ncbi:MAG: hypothetical protein OXG30_00305 [bacterium]|nr:hypothetical protein [bacterium]